ncbi:MAG: nucleotidyltransferase domain-containing protein [Thermoguttaceae bacterium]
MAKAEVTMKTQNATQDIAEKLQETIRLIVSSVDTEKVFLFGSHAYGQPTSASDYDLYVVISDQSGSAIEAMQQMYVCLSKVPMPTPIDILALPVTRFNARAQLPTLERKVITDGVLLYEKHHR